MADHAAPSTTGGTVYDALIRAWRTFYVAIGYDALIMIGTGLTALLTEHEVTSEAFWITLGILTAKSVATSLASFLLRLKVTPKNVVAESPAVG